MRKLGFTLLAAGALAGCQHKPYDEPARGLASLNEPVIARTDFAMDVAAPAATGLAPGEAQRLDAWFKTLVLGYGDAVYLDGTYSEAERREIAEIAGRYGLLLSEGAPVTPSAVPAGTVRVVVSRTSVGVPGCPDWNQPAQPNHANKTTSNFGCAVNANLAQMVADPNDLIRGREGEPYSDAATGAKAINLYRNWPLTAVTDGQGKRPLKTEVTRRD